MSQKGSSRFMKKMKEKTNLKGELAGGELDKDTGGEE
jgi:hypothetical protein